MTAAHQGIEIRELPGVGTGQKVPTPAHAHAQTMAEAGRAQRPPEIKPGPPPVLTKRGADVLVQVEKMLDDEARTTGKTSATEPSKPPSSSALPLTDSFAAATPGDADATTASPKN
jgi:penicillin-binding protein 1A